MQCQSTGSSVRMLLALIMLAFVAFPIVTTRADGDEGRSYYGTINALPNTQGWIGDWVVSGKTIRVTAATRIFQEQGAVAVGAYIEVQGLLQTDGSINANRIEVKVGNGGGAFVKFEGTIESLPATPGRIGEWIVSGRRVRVTATTQLQGANGPIAVGATAEVEGNEQTGGVVNAFRIEIKQRTGGGNEFRFTAAIESLPNTANRIGEWVIGGVRVMVTAQTVIRQEQGMVMVGAFVEVEGMRQTGGALLATKIETRSGAASGNYVKFYGHVESLPSAANRIGDWVVSGRTVRVTATTRVRQEYGPIGVGTVVEVEGTRQSDGSISAVEIEAKEPLGTGSAATIPNFIKFYGTVSTLPNTQGFIGDWVVSGTTVRVTSATTVDQSRALAVAGAYVEVKGSLQTDGSVNALVIEVKHLAGAGNVPIGYVKFFGTISTLPSTAGFIGDWVVAAKTVHVTTTTRIDQTRGAVVVGAYVEVEGNQRSDGTVDATKIEVKGVNASGTTLPANFVKFYGTINSFPSTTGFVGVWMVSARTVHVTAATRIDQRLAAVAVGAYVVVRGSLRADGSIDAVEIEVKPGTGTGTGCSCYIKFQGTVVSLPGTGWIGEWMVGGRRVRVGNDTRIRREYGQVAVGAYVEIEGAQSPNGMIDATEIEVKQNGASGNFIAFNPASPVSAASYFGDNSSDSIVAMFGAQFGPNTAAASALPLPTTLGGVTVLVDDKPAALFFVSPTQINFVIPTETQSGLAQVMVMNGPNVVAQSALAINPISPSVFTANASGQGVPAGVLLRVRANGQQSYEPLARFDAGQNRYVAVPIMRQAGDTLFLVLYCTGFRYAPDSDGNAANGAAENARAMIGNVLVPVAFAGPAPGFVAVEQLNIQLPADAGSGSDINVVLLVYDGQGNLSRANPVTIAIQ